MCKCNRTNRSAKCRILFPKPCSLPFYTTFAFNSYIPLTFSLENIFLYLFSLFLILLSIKLIVEIRASKRQKYQQCELLSGSAMNRIPTRIELQTPNFFQDLFCSCHERTPAFFFRSSIAPNAGGLYSSSWFWRYSSRRLALVC